MNRIEIAQACLDNRESRVYLEIGVAVGTTFRRISASTKIAVDPAFGMNESTRRQAESRGKETHYFELPSDEFFAQQAEFLERVGIDVALIDGLHTYEQALRDVENTLRYLRDDGVIVMHDCNPASESIGLAVSSYAEFRKKHRLRFTWSGDVWKAIVHLRAIRDDVQAAVLDCDYGVGIVRKGAPESRLQLTPEQIRALDYADLKANRVAYLNLKPVSYLREVLLQPARS